MNSVRWAVPATVPSLFQSSMPVVGVARDEVERAVVDDEVVRLAALERRRVDVEEQVRAGFGAVADPELLAVVEIAVAEEKLPAEFGHAGGRGGNRRWAAR
jgi:hypothetical protein